MYKFKWETFYSLEYLIGISLEKTIECAVVHLHLSFTQSINYSNFSPVILFNCKVVSYHCRWIPKAYLYIHQVHPFQILSQRSPLGAWDACTKRMLHHKIWTYLSLFITKLILYFDWNAFAKYSHLNFSTQLINNVHSKVCKNIHLVEEV